MKKNLFLGLLFSLNLVSLGEAVPGIVFDENPNLIFACDYYTEKKCVIRGFETNKKVPSESEAVDLKVNLLSNPYSLNSIATLFALIKDNF